MNQMQKLIIKITIVIVLIVSTISLIIFFNRDSLTKKGQFIIPKMEDNAINGKPDNIEKECMYQEAKVSDDYIVYLCASPLFQDNKLNIYFTSFKNNKGLMRIKVLDSKNNIIGESGLISPNSYIKDVLIDTELGNNDRITIKIMHYEKETYYSLGEIKLDLLVRKS